MKRLTVRLPEALAAEIEVEAQNRCVSKSDIIRERLQADCSSRLPLELAGIADLIGSVDDDLPADLSARKKHYLRLGGCGRKRRRPVGIWDGRPLRPSTDHDSGHDEP
jgi:Arc/MetJ-type ribon-helix-helix transcriptional regulator